MRTNYCLLLFLALLLEIPCPANTRYNELVPDDNPPRVLLVVFGAVVVLEVSELSLLAAVDVLLIRGEDFIFLHTTIHYVKIHPTVHTRTQVEGERDERQRPISGKSPGRYCQ